MSSLRTTSLLLAATSVLARVPGPRFVTISASAERGSSSSDVEKVHGVLALDLGDDDPTTRRFVRRSARLYFPPSLSSDAGGDASRRFCAPPPSGVLARSSDDDDDVALLVRRGGCPFSSKVEAATELNRRAARETGAPPISHLIVYDDTPPSRSELFRPVVNATASGGYRPHLTFVTSDDGARLRAMVYHHDHASRPNDNVFTHQAHGDVHDLDEDDNNATTTTTLKMVGGLPIVVTVHQDKDHEVLRPPRDDKKVAPDEEDDDDDDLSLYGPTDESSNRYNPNGPFEVPHLFFRFVLIPFVICIVFCRCCYGMYTCIPGTRRRIVLRSDHEARSESSHILTRAFVLSLPTINYDGGRGKHKRYDDGDEGRKPLDVERAVPLKTRREGGEGSSQREEATPLNDDDVESALLLRTLTTEDAGEGSQRGKNEWAEATPPNNIDVESALVSSKLCKLSSCAICLDDFETGERLRLLPCGHYFHTNCVLPWLTERQDCCPLCKTNVWGRLPTEKFSDDDDLSDTSANTW